MKKLIFLFTIVFFSAIITNAAPPLPTKTTIYVTTKKHGTVDLTTATMTLSINDGNIYGQTYTQDWSDTYSATYTQGAWTGYEFTSGTVDVEIDGSSAWARASFDFQKSVSETFDKEIYITVNVYDEENPQVPRS